MKHFTKIKNYLIKIWLTKALLITIDWVKIKRKNNYLINRR